MSRKNDSLAADLVKGAIAGAAGTWVMNRVIDAMYEHEDRPAYLPEQRAQVDGKYPTTVLADKVGRAAGLQLSREQQERAGLGIHWSIGIGFGAAHAALRHRVPVLGAGHGLVHGFILFLVEDEAAKSLFGLASPPQDYPWQSHARGLVGHLVLGAVTDTVLDVLS